MKRKIIQCVNKYRPESFILMYHKIYSGVKIDPWRLNVSENNFESQLLFLKKHYKVINLEQFVRNKKENKMEPRTVAITFDDGYKDCFTTAFPLLKKHGIPATFFVNSGYIENQEEFWPDRLIRLLLVDKKLPEKDLYITCVNRTWANEKAKHPNTQERSRFFMDVWYTLLQLHPVMRNHALQEIEEWINFPTTVLEHSKAMTKEELIAMAKDPLISIGGHTTNHVALKFMDKESQREEIESNKFWLEKVLRKPIAGFAYPNGEFNKNSVLLMKEYGFDYACTTRELRNSHYVSDYKLPRFQVCDWNKGEFEAKLKAW